MNYPFPGRAFLSLPASFCRWAFVFTLVLVFAAAARAQNAGGAGTVQGRIFNPATGEYVRNAEVRVQGTDRVTYSEEGGSYVLANVPAGTLSRV